jgi:hypothetical protein
VSVVERLVHHYRVEEGLILDVEAGTVEVDPDFDAGGAQQRRHLMVEHDHHVRAIDTALNLLGQSAPLPPNSVESALVVPATRADRGALEQRLRALEVSESDSKTAVFVLAYLSGNTADLDCVEEVPVLIDPAEELKPVVAGRLAELQSVGWVDSGRGQWERITQLLNPGDRALADTARSQALAHTGAPAAVLWDTHIDRVELAELVWDYRDQLRTMVTAGEQLAASAVLDDRDWDMIGAGVAQLRHTREMIEAVAAHPDNTLLGIENSRLRHVLDTFDLGDTRTDRILFVGEFAMQQTDVARHYGRGERIAATGAAAITDVLQSTVANRAPALLHPDSEAVDIADQYSTYLRLTEIARGRPSDPHAAAEMISGVWKYLDDAGASAEEAIVVSSEVRAWVRAAEDQGRQVISRQAQWTQRITVACQGREDATLRFAPRDLGAPQPQITVEQRAIHNHTVILDALPYMDRRAHSPAVAEPGSGLPTDPGPEAEAQP